MEAAARCRPIAAAFAEEARCPLHITGRGLSAALLELVRVEQQVRVVRSVFGRHTISGRAKEPLFTVVVAQQGKDWGRYYEVRRRTLNLLQDGISPETLELEEIDEPDVEA